MKSVHANPPEKICRLCLSDSGVILPIFEGEVAERFSVPLPQKILSCLAIKVCADDPLPPHICHRCLYEVDRFHEFRETCKRTNTTFNKICNNSGDSIPFDVNQVLEIKQELHDESIYHDAISDLLSDDEVADISSSRIRKRNRCISLLESMKRVHQAQSAVSANSSHTDQIPSEWMEQSSKSSQPNGSNANSTLLSTALECRFCAKPFMYESTLVEHEELHAKGVVTGNDSIDDVEQLAPKGHVGHEPLVPSSAPVEVPTTQTSHSPSPAVIPSVTVAALSPVPSVVCPVLPTPAPAPAPTPAVDPAQRSAPAPAPSSVLTLPSVPLHAHAPVTTPAPVPNPTTIPIPTSPPTPIPIPTSTPAPILTPTPAPAPDTVHLSPGPPPDTAAAAAPAAPAPTISPKPTLSGPVLSGPIPTPATTSDQIIDTPLVSNGAYESHTASNQETSNSQHAVDCVSLTDVTAMLLEGAFEGVRTMNNPAPSLCRYCQEPFNNTDLLRRHERLYCNRKPSLMKQKQILPLQPQPQQQHIQQNSQHPVEISVPSDEHTQVLVQRQQSQGHPSVATSQQLDQQIIYNQKVMVESTPIDAPWSCKYCHKDFIHRGSLWRHQMFCDANPERDMNRIVAGSKKKSVVTKDCNQRNDAQPPNISGVGTLSNNNSSVCGPQARRGNTQQNSGPLKCKFCEKRFLHRGSWWRHQKMFCAVNPEIPSVKAEARSRSIQGTTNFACRYCERTFLHRGSCWHHEQTHTGIKEHACRYCSKTFNEKSRLARHERMHLGIKPFSCRQCGKAFCDASNLRNHEQIHGDRASFLCAWCGKSYTRRALLLKHELVHAGEAQIFQCSSCPRTFPDLDTLNEHSLSHTQEKRRIFLCQTCGQTFRSQRLLSQHSDINHSRVLAAQQTQPTQLSSSVNRVHLAQEPAHHGCTICNKSFPDLAALQQHKLLHNSESKQYCCPHNACTAVFLEQSLLEAHLNFHGGEKTHSLSSSITLNADSSLHQNQLQHTHSQQDQQQQSEQDEQLLSIQHQHALQDELLHREGTYVIDGQDIPGQTISVPHLVGQIP